MLSDWFETNGLRQGDPNLASFYLNFLVNEINMCNTGVKLGSEMISLLMYADDIVLISETEHRLQTMLNKFESWCKKLRMNCNLAKTRIIHFRKTRVRLTNSDFYLCNERLNIVPMYKYLGLYFDEYLSYEHGVILLSNSGVGQSTIFNN